MKLITQKCTHASGFLTNLSTVFLNVFPTRRVISVELDWQQLQEKLLNQYAQSFLFSCFKLIQVVIEPEAYLNLQPMCNTLGLLNLLKKDTSDVRLPLFSDLFSLMNLSLHVFMGINPQPRTIPLHTFVSFFYFDSSLIWEVFTVLCENDQYVARRTQQWRKRWPPDHTEG